MFRLLADESATRHSWYRLRGPGLSLAVHLAAILAITGKSWLLALLGTLATVPQPPPATYRLTILTPPPGKPIRRESLRFHTGTSETLPAGAPARIEDGTDIVFDADDTRQLLPVLAAYGGLIVFVPVLDRVHPKDAFRPDGTAAAIPATLDHWVRIRLPNTSWWPEVEAMCSAANSDGALEAVAVFPPAYRSALGAAIQSRMTELKSSGHVVGIGLRLDAGRPAGVQVRAIRLAAVNRIG